MTPNLIRVRLTKNGKPASIMADYRQPSDYYGRRPKIAEYVLDRVYPANERKEVNYYAKAGQGIMRVSVTAELIEESFRKGCTMRASECIDGLPADATLVNAGMKHTVTDGRVYSEVVLDFSTLSVTEGATEIFRPVFQHIEARRDVYRARQLANDLCSCAQGTSAHGPDCPARIFAPFLDHVPGDDHARALDLLQEAEALRQSEPHRDANLSRFEPVHGELNCQRKPGHLGPCATNPPDAKKLDAEDEKRMRGDSILRGAEIHVHVSPIAPESLNDLLKSKPLASGPPRKW